MAASTILSPLMWSGHKLLQLAISHIKFSSNLIGLSTFLKYASQNNANYYLQGSFSIPMELASCRWFFPLPFLT